MYTSVPRATCSLPSVQERRIMPWAIPVSCFVILSITAVVLAYRFRRRNDRGPVQIKIRPDIRSGQFDGWATLQLEAINRSDLKIWLEDAEFLIGDLDANYQTALPSNRKVHSIKQAIQPRESLTLSIASTLYEAAGKPQGNFSFEFVGNVRYRLGQRWQEIRTDHHRIEMAALSVLKFKRLPAVALDDSAFSTNSVGKLALASDGTPRNTERLP
jgi:hypothetical protein